MILCWTSIAATSACGTAPTLPEFAPEAEPPAEIKAPEPLCNWPDPIEIERDGVEYAAFDAAAFLQIRLCQETELANHDIAADNAETAEAMRDAYEEAIAKGGVYRELALFKLEQLEARRRDAWIEAQGYKLGLALAAIASLL